jgi:signal transduction histidine kinase
MLGSYVVYDYRKELLSNLQNSLNVLAEDVVSHGLYNEDPATVKASFHFLESYHEAPFITLFDELTFAYHENKPSQIDGAGVVKALPDGRFLSVRSTQDAVDAKSMALSAKLVLVFGSVLLLFILIFAAYLSRLLQPLRCLVRFCRNSTAKTSNLPHCSGSAEVGELKKAITDLLESNHTLCKQKQDIFKEAAHEIKAPIAILKARLALFKQNSSFDKASFISESEEDIATISNKLKELLFLKAVEWDMRKQKERVAMQAQCGMMQKAFRPILEKKGLSMVSNWEEDFSLYIHKEAMQKVMQAIFENIFMHTKNNSTITNHIDSKKRQLHIVNEMGDKSDETLFSSFIGSKMIARLSEKLGYTYDVREKDGLFYTTITFAAPEPDASEE